MLEFYLRNNSSTRVDSTFPNYWAPGFPLLTTHFDRTLSFKICTEVPDGSMAQRSDV